MIGEKEILAIIPARGGSKGLPMKNIRILLNRPLIAWTIEAAKKSKFIDRIIVSTDSLEIAEISKSFGAEVPFLRPQEIANDQSSGNSVIIHALDWIEKHENKIYDYFVLLQPTSPLRETWQIDEAILKLVESRDANSIVSVKEVDEHPYWMKKINMAGYMDNYIEVQEGNKRRQDLPKVFVLNGAIYISKTDYFVKTQNFYLSKCLPYIMDKMASVDIDDINDFYLAELLMKSKLSSNC